MQWDSGLGVDEQTPHFGFSGGGNDVFEEVHQDKCGAVDELGSLRMIA